MHHHFEIAVYLTVAMGFITLALTGGLGVIAVILVSLALLLRGYLLLTRRSWLISEHATSFLTLGYLGIYAADFFLLSRGFLDATVHLVLFVMVVRLFSAHRDRDYYFLSVIAFLMVLSAALLTVDSTFLLAFACFTLSAVVTFILMEMRHISRKAAIRTQQSDDETSSRHIATTLAAVSPVLMLCILLTAAGIFFVLPRVSAGYLSAYAPGGEISTGFSDQIELGRIGEIQQSSSLVMHVHIDGDDRGAFDLKWRGITLRNFDGRNWSNNRSQRVLFQRPGEGFILPKPIAGVRDIGRRPIHYRVLMEPVGINVFFLAARPEELEGDYKNVGMDEGGAIFNLDLQHPVNRYQASSDIAQPAPSVLRRAGGNYPPDLDAGYLELPRTLDPRIRSLAEQITASSDNRYDKASAIETYLRTHFQYTLQLSRTVPRDPLANFLFERKQGHCEYFASSMAIMLRTLGIPARIVNGFHSGEFNDLTSQYVIRASDAHSWVEAFFPNYGWISFDPTPGVSTSVRAGWNRVALYVDAMASFWRDWVINYDAGHQQALAVGAKSGSQQLFSNLKTWWRQHYELLLKTARRSERVVDRSPWKWAIAGFLIAMLLIVGANAGLLWQLLARRRLAAKPEKSPRVAASIWYERMIGMVGRRGWRKSPTQTPEEFIELIDDDAVRDKVAEFTRHYESARFDASIEDVQQLPRLYEEISATRR
jgi:protein-glutamine gamma-glutamyltransferase